MVDKGRESLVFAARGDRSGTRVKQLFGGGFVFFDPSPPVLPEENLLNIGADHRRSRSFRFPFVCKLFTSGHTEPEKERGGGGGPLGSRKECIVVYIGPLEPYRSM